MCDKEEVKVPEVQEANPAPVTHESVVQNAENVDPVPETTDVPVPTTEVQEEIYEMLYDCVNCKSRVRVRFTKGEEAPDIVDSKTCPHCGTKRLVKFGFHRSVTTKKVTFTLDDSNELNKWLERIGFERKEDYWPFPFATLMYWL